MGVHVHGFQGTANLPRMSVSRPDSQHLFSFLNLDVWTDSHSLP